MLYRSAGILALTLLCSLCFLEVTDPGATPFESIQNIELTDSSDAPEDDKNPDSNATFKLRAGATASESLSRTPLSHTSSSPYFSYYSQGPPRSFA